MFTGLTFYWTHCSDNGSAGARKIVLGGKL